MLSPGAVTKCCEHNNKEPVPRSRDCRNIAFSLIGGYNSGCSGTTTLITNKPSLPVGSVQLAAWAC